MVCKFGCKQISYARMSVYHKTSSLCLLSDLLVNLPRRALMLSWEQMTQPAWIISMARDNNSELSRHPKP